MHTTLNIDPSLNRDELRLSASEDSPQVQAVKHYAEQLGSPVLLQDKLLCYNADGKVLLMELAEVANIFASDKKVYAQTTHGRLELRKQLYELEQELKGSAFVRISHSEIVNFNAVAALDLSLTGTIVLRFKSGAKSFVARRYVRKIKDYLGL
jgi:DNA-binding LytR/AlgR family response regulator